MTYSRLPFGLPNHLHVYNGGTYMDTLDAITIDATADVSTGVYPAINTSYYFPIVLDYAFEAKRVWWVNGGTSVAGNFDVGIYTSDGTKLVSSGSTARSGTNTVQFADITDTILAPGRYYLGCSSDSVTGQFWRLVCPNVFYADTAGIKEEATFPLPTTATMTTATATTYPVIGLTRSTTL